MATAELSNKFQLSSSLSTLSALGKGRLGFGVGVGGSAGGLFMSSEDQRLSQQVQEKHSPDGRQVDVRPLLHLVEDIFARANQTVILGAEVESKAKGAVEANAGVGAGLALGAGTGGNVGVAAGAGGTLAVGGGVGGNLAVGGGLGGNLGLGGGIGGNLGLGGGIGGNLGLGGGADLGVSVGGSLDASAGVGANLGVEGSVAGRGFEVKGDVTASFDGSPDLPLMIERVSCEMGCKCLGGTVDAHDATFSVLDILSRYSWEAKMVITLAAFAANYGEFLLLSQVYSTNPLAQSMALLKQLPSILQQANDKMKSQMVAINSLITAMLNVTKLIVDFSELPSEYVKPEQPTVKVVHNHFPLAVYWTIRSAVAAATQIALIATMSHEFLPSTTELELSNWSAKLKLIFEFLGKMKISVQKIIDEKQEEEAYNKIRRIIFKMVHQDNMTVLKTLIYNKDDVLPLYDGSNKKRVQLDVLQAKMVLLLVTSLDICQDELTVLENIYNESKTHLYNIVWLPIVDRSVTWNDSMQSQFENTQSAIPWYSVYHPSIVGNAVIKFFNKELNFKGKPILVPLDTQGKITSTNALHMMLIWKNNAFPFTSAREDTLWRQESWRLELLVDNIDQTILNWSKDDKYIFIYGGEDIDWIRKFTKLARDVSAAAKISLEMIYVGKSCKKETARKNNETIEAEKLSHYLKHVPSSWFFWTRLESMLQSLVQLDKVNDDHNKAIQEIKRLISYDKNAGGWAILAKGSELVVSVQGTTIISVLSKFEEWKKRVDELGGAFHIAIHEKIKAEGPEHACCRFEFLTAVGKIPLQMKCPECHNQMQNYITFACCHEGALGGGAAKHEAANHAAAPAI